MPKKCLAMVVIRCSPRFYCLIVLTRGGVAFDNLSEGMKDTLRSLRAVHSSRHVFGESASVPNDMSDMFGNADQATQDAVHPVVIRHPLSGREIL